jgi:transposase
MDEHPPLGLSPAEWATLTPALQAAFRALVARIAVLEGENADLRAQLNQHSGNSSKPPSSDPPSAPPRPSRGAARRQRGAQPGHPGQHHPLLPPDEVSEIHVLHPAQCHHCQAVLAADLPAAVPPQRHQVWEIPPTQPHVTEYQLCAVTCPVCATTTRASLPPAVPPTRLGPRITSLIGLLHGRYRLSMREVVALLADLWHVPLALGSVAASCQIVSAALAPTYTALQTAIQQQPTANLDETGWREAGQRRWLWVAVTTIGTLFLIVRSRGGGVLAQLVGPQWAGIGTSDRWSAYKRLALERRQLCWAHLRREFVACSEHAGPVGTWGATALGQLELLFTYWHGYRDGGLTRGELQAGVGSIQTAFGQLLEHGKDLPWEKARGLSRDLLNLWPALWTFLAVDGVEPTNNAAERALRPAVLWRKGCFGTQSAAGSRFAERMLSVSATCRQQHRHLLTFLTDAVAASWAGTAPPTLIQTP